MIKISGLWQKEGKNGTYFTGKLGDATIKIFPNSYKNNEKQPDYIMYLDESKKKQQGQQQEQEQNESSFIPDDGELPF